MEKKDISGPWTREGLFRKALVGEALLFGCIILVIWLDEVFDLPRWLLGAPATPINWQESLFESCIILGIALAVLRKTRGWIHRLRHLEGFLPMCAACKRVRDDQGDWKPVEAFVTQNSSAQVTHGICPECAEKLYSEYLHPKKSPDQEKS